ncbi:MAG TPA: DinB family protein [Gemmatimonadales bacterium]|jgi:hypothetical protein|nr:DinB family protein [Gemmatimonadales bacterium]
MTAPINPATTDYVRETFALLGDRDPLAIMAETPAWIAERVHGLSDAAMRRPEGPGRWSLVEVLSHLADAEIAFAWRVRIILTQDRPPMLGYDQGAWLTRFDYANADSAEALHVFTSLRHWNYRIWRTTTPADLDRIGMHMERGPETADTLRKMIAGHDLRHRRQIERLLVVVR